MRIEAPDEQHASTACNTPRCLEGPSLTGDLRQIKARLEKGLGCGAVATRGLVGLAEFASWKHGPRRGFGGALIYRKASQRLFASLGDSSRQPPRRHVARTREERSSSEPVRRLPAVQI